MNNLKNRSTSAIQLRDLRRKKRLSTLAWTHRAVGTWRLIWLLVLVGLFLEGFAGTAAAKPKPKIKFDMVPAQTTCLQNAKAHVRVTSLGPVEEMDVDVSGLPPNTEFD